MPDQPKGEHVVCPECGDEAVAIIPPNSKIAKGEEEADGKVWINCHNCGNRFIAYFYRTD